MNIPHIPTAEALPMIPGVDNSVNLIRMVNLLPQVHLHCPSEVYVKFLLDHNNTMEVDCSCSRYQNHRKRRDDMPARPTNFESEGS